MEARRNAYVACCTGPQTIREAVATHAAVLGALREHGDVTLDCTAVSEADLTFVQTILAARLSAAAARQQFTLRAPLPQAVDVAMQRAGFEAAEIAGLMAPGEPT